MATLLAYTSPAAGHLFPLVPGLLELRARGHAVHVRTATAHVAALRAVGLEAAPVDPRIEAIPVADHEARCGPDRLKRGFADLLARGPLDRDDLDAAVAQVRPDALLLDTLAYGAHVAAERGGLPWAITLPSLLPLPGNGIPPYGLGLRPRADAVGRARDALLWRAVVRMYGRAMLPPLNRLRKEAGLRSFFSPLQLFAAPDRLLALSGAPLEYRRDDLPAHVRLVGAQAWDPPAAAPGWLSEPGDPWVLVTCSTEYQGDEQLAATAIEALRDLPLRVLVTLGGAAGRDGARLPRAANARVEPFAPHGPVLARAAAVVCHGGMGIVQKAVGAGVPLVAVPFGRDQPEVARRVAECGAGRVVQRRRLTPEAMRTAVQDALGADARAAAAAAGVQLRAAGGPSAFADAAEELVRSAGADRSARSPGGDLAGRAAAGGAAVSLNPL
ncbi:MAG TPA: glycosyltransferase [Conexibacter sp.]|nr:glycosyltransferase [Conexibacter sp.]